MTRTTSPQAPPAPSYPPSPETALRLDAVTKTYGAGPAAVTALVGLDLALPRGSFTALMGPSGSGKSTFLHCAAGLDRPDHGSVWLGGVDLTLLSAKALTVHRREHVGFVFQSYNLLPALTVEQNVTLPLLLGGRPTDHAHLSLLLEAVGLSQLRDRLPAALSGGQQQRVAIARALIARPDVVFADEPTGALDTRTGQQVLELLRGTAADLGQTVLMVTHDPVAATYADRVVFLADGRFTGHLDRPTAQQVAEQLTHLGEW